MAGMAVIDMKNKRIDNQTTKVPAKRGQSKACLIYAERKELRAKLRRPNHKNYLCVSPKATTLILIPGTSFSMCRHSITVAPVVMMSSMMTTWRCSRRVRSPAMKPPMLSIR